MFGKIEMITFFLSTGHSTPSRVSSQSWHANRKDPLRSREGQTHHLNRLTPSSLSTKAIVIPAKNVRKQGQGPEAEIFYRPDWQVIN